MVVMLWLYWYLQPDSCGWLIIIIIIKSHFPLHLMSWLSVSDCICSKGYAVNQFAETCEECPDGRCGLFVSLSFVVLFSSIPSFFSNQVVPTYLSFFRICFRIWFKYWEIHPKLFSLWDWFKRQNHLWRVWELKEFILFWCIIRCVVLYNKWYAYFISFIISYNMYYRHMNEECMHVLCV